MHFAGFKVGHTPQLHMTYLMRRGDKGSRVGVTRTYTAGQAKPVLGLGMRCAAERADAAWVISTHASDAEARFAETQHSLVYGIPTLPFKARPRGAPSGLVADQALIDRVFLEIDSDEGGVELLDDVGLSLDHPHYIPRSHEGRRRNVTITLCGDRRGATPMHLVAVGGRDEEGARALAGLGLSVRPAKAGSRSWRYETAVKDYRAALELVDRIRAVLDVTVRPVARLGAGTDGSNSLPFTPAASVRPGMAMFAGDGSFDIVERVESVALPTAVYDLDIEHTHNFVADGLVTHNSIYSFRGADIRNILEFEDDHPDAHVVRLEQNYRSTQTILNAANAVVAHNRGRKTKSLWTDGDQGDRISIREMPDEHAEARYVVAEIERLVDEGESRSEIAVFYRTNSQSRVLEDMLVRAQIGYQVIGGTKFYDRAEVKDAMAYLVFLVNPQDEGAFARIVNAPKRGLGATSVGRVLQHADTTGVPVWEAAEDPDGIPTLGSAARKALARFMSVMVRLRERAESGAPVGDVLEEALSESGYLEALRVERTIESQGRIENLEELVRVAREYDETTAGEGTLGEFLQQVALLSDADTARDDDGVVTLMTLHNAKGLEFPIVFVIGCEDGVFPHSRALDEGQLEEERRLCYVAITRARRRLAFTYARRRSGFGGGSDSWGLRSRFLDEIPAELTDQPDRNAVGAGRPAGMGRVASWANAAAATAAAQPDTAGQVFRMGDDVIHAAFGDGVVTGVEPGGVVVVRFAGDGSERKLMADYAPIRRR
jgi:hypothetical protein